MTTSADLLPVTVFPRHNVDAWDSTTDLEHTVKTTTDGREYVAKLRFPQQDLRAMLTTKHREDVHFQTVFAPSYPDVTVRWATAAASLVELYNCAFVVDVDRVGHTPWPTPTDAESAVNALAGRLPQAAIYASRSGLRVIFLPKEPIPVAAYKVMSNRAFDRINKALREVDLDKVVEVDVKSQEWSRIFRAPYVVRDGKASYDTAFLTIPDDWQPVDLGGLPTPFELTLLATGVEGDAPDDAEAPPLGTAEWDALEEAIGPYVEKRWRPLLKKLRAEEVFYDKGSRNQDTFRAVALVVEALTYSVMPASAPDPRLVFRMFRPLAARGTSGTPASVCVAELWGQCARLTAAIKHRLLQEQFTSERVEDNLASIELPWLTVCNNVYFILEPKRGTYRPAITNASLVAPLLDMYCGPSGVDVKNKRGEMISVGAAFRKYGRQIGNVVWKIGTEGAAIVGDTLMLGTCKPQDVMPVYHADVDRWLQALTGGGDDYEIMLDWLATVRRTDAPTCAVYLDGPGSAGKGMFADGVASLWGQPPAKFDKAISKFNGSILECPIVQLDEGSTLPAREVATAFRSLTGESHHDVEQKGQEVAKVRGCYRVIICANGPNALPFPKSQTQNDHEAIIMRVAHFEVRAEAVEFLANIGGRSGTANWVYYEDNRPGKIAEHIVWLEENRRVSPTRSGRFLVQGKRKPWHEQIVASSGGQATALAVAATLLVAGNGGNAVSALNTIGKDGLRLMRIYPRALRALWPQAGIDSRVPDLKDISMPLRSIMINSGGSGPRGTYVDVTATAVLSAAASVSATDPGMLRAMLTPPPKVDDEGELL